MKNPSDKYLKRRDKYKLLLEKQKKQVNLISNLRLFDVLVAIASFVFFYRSGDYSIAWGTMGIYILIFSYLVILHSKAIRRREFIVALYDVNDMSIKRLNEEWKDFKDRGEEFKDDNHPFSGDLDIFGKSSLFQWISTANTESGRRTLSRDLMYPGKNTEEIKSRQKAIKELSHRLWWRHRFSAEGLMVSGKLKGEEELLLWAGGSSELYNNPVFVLLLRLIPAITISTLIFSYILHIIPTIVPKLLLLAQFGALFIGAQRNSILGRVHGYKSNIRLYSKMLKYLEKNKFNSPYIKNLQTKLLNSKNENSSSQIARLERIVDSISNRGNMMFLPINVLLLWDYQCMVSLERWRRSSGKLIKNWIGTIGEMESLSSLAVIGHDHLDWVVPEFTEKPSVLRAKNLGHPLLTKVQVRNDVDIEEPTKSLLITGSNMSGKSTYLRTAGINLVLAYAGAPVCATHMKCSIMNIHTCMRVSDNLDKNISSFYAELLRIRDIVHASKSNPQVFYLLDEIFKGTNSQDRHTGAKLVIKKLCENGAIGMVSTHDLELGELEKESKGEIRNYHFQECYENNEIKFDYKLRTGISTTRNAMYLIKMVGIESSDK
jgi:hypothetical protein